MNKANLELVKSQIVNRKTQRGNNGGQMTQAEFNMNKSILNAAKKME
jgi:hypothetical protein